MKITVTGSLGNISRRLTQQLIQKGHQVTVISHDPNRAKAIEEINATAAIGSIEDENFLVEAFKGADAVYTMIPPSADTDNYPALVKTISSTFARAIDKAAVRYVVNLSSIGAHHPEGNGPSSAFYYEENVLNQLPQTHVLHLRAGMFYTNFYGNIEMIKHFNIIGNNFESTVKLVLSHPHDIADIAADALDTLSFKGKTVRYVVSDEKRGEQIAQLIGNAIGKPDLPWVTFADEQLLEGMKQNGFSPHMAAKFVELGISIREGRMFEHYEQNKPKELGKIRFEDFAAEFASVYNRSLSSVTA